MLRDIGLITLAIAFLFSVYGVVASAYGGWGKRPEWVESARKASLAVFPLLTVSVAAVVYALYKMDFSLAYVADVSSRSMSPFLRITALWGGQQGSILFWAWLMAGFVGVLLVRKWEQNRELMPYVMFAAMITTAFFVGLSLFITNPFERFWHIVGDTQLITAVFQPPGAMAYIPEDGGGLNPLLRHFGMIGHPPTTYMGFTGFVIPFSYAIAALITGRAKEDTWITASRRWTLIAWIFLSIGLVLGGRWAYDVLGWGGFWGWDPVENAMLMPWLTGTAFLHSVMMTEKRGMLKKWSIVLILLTYSLALFGTFITRTGVISSVHSFSKSALGMPFLIFISLTFLGSLWLLIRGWGELKTEHNLESLISRESAFVAQNLLFIGITFAVFWGTVFPMLSELVVETKITVGPPYYKKVTGPLFAALVLLMGIAPLIAWRKHAVNRLGKAILAPLILSLGFSALWGYSHRMHPAAYPSLWLVSFVVLTILFEFWKGIDARTRRGEPLFLALRKLIGRNHRRYGGYIIHLGVVLIAMGFIGDSYFKEETQGTLSPGESIPVGQYSLRFDKLEVYSGTDGREILEATTSLFKDGEFVRGLKPRRDYFVAQQQPVSVPGVLSGVSEDVYVLLVGWEGAGLTKATFRIYRNPLINWTWVGGLVLILGTIIAVWTPPGNFGQVSYTLRRKINQPQPVSGD